MMWQLFHEKNPYEGFDAGAYPVDLFGWHGEKKTFEELIKEIKPKVIIEVGSWKGQSALMMAQYCRAEKLDFDLLAVDTWLGSLDFWSKFDDEDRYKSLKCINGYPSVYYQFLANVKRVNGDKWITPIPLPSNIAHKLIAHRGIKADLIYIDGSHEYIDVVLDIINYWNLLNPGGVMFGDDFDCAPVRDAVIEVANKTGLKFEVKENLFWVMRKEK